VPLLQERGDTSICKNKAPACNNNVSTGVGSLIAAKIS